MKISILIDEMDDTLTKVEAAAALSKSLVNLATALAGLGSIIPGLAVPVLDSSEDIVGTCVVTDDDD